VCTEEGRCCDAGNVLEVTGGVAVCSCCCSHGACSKAQYDELQGHCITRGGVQVARTGQAAVATNIFCDLHRKRCALCAGLCSYRAYTRGRRLSYKEPVTRLLCHYVLMITDCAKIWWMPCTGSNEYMPKYATGPHFGQASIRHPGYRACSPTRHTACMLWANHIKMM
jgi:hypothetical protein